jgi:hypothetical protein
VLVDGSFEHQFLFRAGTVLAKTVNAVSGLALRHGIPFSFHEHEVRTPGEIEAFTASLTDDHHVSLTILEGVCEFLALPGGRAAVNDQGGDPTVSKSFFETTDDGFVVRCHDDRFLLVVEFLHHLQRGGDLLDTRQLSFLVDECEFFDA